MAKRKSLRAKRAAAWPATEAELNAVLVAALEKEGWDVYQEVFLPEVGGVADIVARRGERVLVVEGKRRLSLTLLAQAGRWAGYAHHVAILTPLALPKAGSETQWVRQVCDWMKLSWFKANAHGVVIRLQEPQEARLADYWDRVLCPEQKTYALSGTNRGFWTPFKKTVRELTSYVLDHPGCALKDAVDGIRHHYKTSRSAVASLQRLLQHGGLPACRWSCATSAACGRSASSGRGDWAAALRCCSRLSHWSWRTTYMPWRWPRLCANSALAEHQAAFMFIYYIIPTG